MGADYYLELKNDLIALGYKHEIDWQTNLQPVSDAFVFRNECIWVILNSGLKEQIARSIWNSIQSAWAHGFNTDFAFKHPGKVKAIDFIRENYEAIFDGYCTSLDRLTYLQNIPFIGPITKYHLAKNLGYDVVKPDRHLVRIAKEYGYDNPTELCNSISAATGDKICVVDLVLWRSANLGLL
jgi:hypothetical protein